MISIEMAEETPDKNTDGKAHTSEAGIEDSVELGGNIKLSGLKDLDRSEVIVIKKIVGTFARRFSEICDEFEELNINFKKFRKKEKSEMFELKAHVRDKGKQYDSKESGRNLFFVLDEALKKLEREVQKDTKQ